MPDLARAAWLQAMMSRRMVTDIESRQLYKSACSAARVEYQASRYDDFIHDASSAISSSGLEVRRMVDEVTGKPVVALVNTKGDETAQLATGYTAQELSLINLLIEAIFTADEDQYSLGNMAVLALAGKAKPAMTKVATQELVNSLCRHQWLHISPRGRVSFTARTLLELQNTLKEQFPEYAIECARCRELVTRGAACAAPADNAADEEGNSCSTKVHLMCEKQLPGYTRGRATCPGCKKPWVSTHFGAVDIGDEDGSLGENGEEDEAQEAASASRGGSDTHGRRTRRRPVSGVASDHAANKRKRTSSRIAESEEEEGEETEESDGAADADSREDADSADDDDDGREEEED